VTTAHPIPNTEVLVVTRVPAFDDNYLWLIHSPLDFRKVVVVDPGDDKAIEAVLQREQWELAAILTTHHHADHVGGVQSLVERHHVPVYGPIHDPIPCQTVAVRQGDRVDLPQLGLSFAVLDVPGHTKGHVAYYGHGAVFCGDTLFSGGCGRLFEGTPAQMLQSLDQLGALPAETLIYCAHEYTESNLRFARAADPRNDALKAYQDVVLNRRQAQQATVPALLAMEQSINPFLRSRHPDIRATLVAERGLPAAVSDADAFAALREWKNEFKG